MEFGACPRPLIPFLFSAEEAIKSDLIKEMARNLSLRADTHLLTIKTVLDKQRIGINDISGLEKSVDKIDLAITESANTVLNNEAILSVSGLFRNTIDTYVRRFIPDIRAYAKARDVIGLRKTASLFLHNSWIILGALGWSNLISPAISRPFQVKGISKKPDKPPALPEYCSQIRPS